MATLRELIIKISANSTSYQSEMARASRMGSEYYKTMEGGSRKAEAATRQSRRALAELNNELVTVKESASGMVSMFAGAFAVGSLISTADQYGQISSRIKMATESQAEYNQVQRRLMEISDRTYKSIEEQSELYIRSANSMKELGYSTEGTIDFIDSISSALTINAASADKGESAINALSKSMVNGKVAGNEWHTVMEVMPTVIGDIARYLGTTENEVKKLGASGKLSMDTFAKATIAAKDRNAELAEAMPTTVGDALTKLSNHWKAYIGDANASMGMTAALSGTISLAADNIDVLAIAGAGLVGLGMARYFGGVASSVTNATSSLITATQSQLALAAAQVSGIEASLAQIRTERESTVAAQQSLVAQLSLAQTEKARASIRAQLSVNSAAIAAAARAETAATDALTAAKNRLNIAGSLLNKVLGLVGGPVGVATIAAGTLFYFHEKAEQAKKSATELAGGVNELIGSMQRMNNMQLASEIAKLRSSLPALSEVVEDTQHAFDLASREVRTQQALLSAYGSDAVKAAKYTQSLQVAEDALAIATKDLSDAENAKSRAVNGANLLTAQLNGTVKTGTDLLQSNAVEIGVVAGMMNHLAGALDFASRAKENFNSTNLLLAPLSDELQKAQKAQDDKLAILKLSGREQAKEIARQEAERQKITDPREVSTFVSGELKIYDQTEQNKAAEEVTRKTASAAKTAESATKAYEQAIANLNKEIQVETVRLSQGDAAASLFASSIETGAKYTDAQRTELERLNKTLAESKQRWEDHNAAIASDPYRSAADSQRQAQEQLQRQVDGGEIQSQRELYQRKEKIHYDYLTALASANQTYAVSGSANLAGDVDPVVNLQNQLAKQRALYETYYAEGILSKQRFEELMVAATNQSAKQQQNAAIELYRSQSDLHTLQMDLISNVGDRTANMVTGVLSGQQSFSEAMNNMANTIMDTVVKAFIQAQTQAIMFQMVSGVTGGVSGAASSGAANSSFSGGAYSGLSFNAKGGVYDSPSLSAYSGQIVSSPTLFAFAKGAGVMGEAGPEAIMPLTRAADGSLGVRSVTARQPDIATLSSGGDVGVTQTNQFHFTINGSGDQALLQAMETAARNGAAQAKAELLKDLRTNGPARRTLGV
ncbi:tape measure protein [Yersinia mollaretii]|uniref:tape measure protein n=1 Tax=Yersinia mollaretii TaxID=33060 RepID=UPI0011AA3327|nr:tape measure protein [Yersinia mollaretii]